MLPLASAPPWPRWGPGRRTASAAVERPGGVHVSVLTHGVSPEPLKGYPHHFTMTVYGPDNALTGMGWGGATDVKTLQDVLNSQMFPCIYGLTGVLEGDVLKVHGLMVFSRDPGDQGRPLSFEANLSTGFLRAIGQDANLVFEGQGVVARI